MSTPNPPAFPYTHDPLAERDTAFSGMTLRDYFAAAALSGMRANTDIRSKPEEVAMFAFEDADAMLKARDA